MTRHGQRGFALLLVLWTVALLALLSTWLVVAARDRMAMMNDQRLAATLGSAADGAVQHAIFALLKDQWAPDGTIRMVQIGVVNVSVFMEDEALKLNPDFASVAELQALLQSLAVSQRQAAMLAAAIVDWRTPADTPTAVANDGSVRNDQPPGIPFARLADIAVVPGMTPDIMQRLRPHLTLFTDADQVPGDNAMRLISILAIAHGPDHAMFARHIIVRTNARRSGRRYEILMSDRDAAMAELYPGAERINVTP